MVDTSASVQEMLDSGEFVREYALQVDLILEGWTYTGTDGSLVLETSQAEWVPEGSLDMLEKRAEVRYPANDVRIISRIAQADPDETKRFPKR